MYEQSQLPIREDLRTAHETVWRKIATTGSYWSGENRVAFIREARSALTCKLCASRKISISPNVVDGEHDSATSLDPMVIDLIHRIRTDPGRYTKTVFDRFVSTYSIQEYIELVSVVASSVVVDTMHCALGLTPPDPSDPDTQKPNGYEPAKIEDGGAWVPLARHDQSRSDLGFRRVPNILRAMGAVPSAVSLFFSCFKNHYSMMGVPLDLRQSQTEFIAARVSALNQCFY
ncbi:MAG: alkylhydroperoxidase-related (seleno)protein [Gammaproteobacteria bacterium]|nr:alkylhydroperoxidase-related (seleno)protein [Gammaproteobacteria bacterium]